MADFISRIGNNVPPTYPIRPVKPPQRDEKSGEEKRRQDSSDKDEQDGGDDESPRHIDEHV